MANTDPPTDPFPSLAELEKDYKHKMGYLTVRANIMQNRILPQIMYAGAVICADDDEIALGADMPVFGTVLDYMHEFERELQEAHTANLAYQAALKRRKP